LIGHRLYTAPAGSVPDRSWEPNPATRCTREAESRQIEQAKQGDISAYEALVARYQGAATRLAAVIAGSADAEDIAQEAFVKAYYALHRFDGDAPFSPWLMRIVANEARNHRRSSGRRGRLALRMMSVDTHVEVPEDVVVSNDRRATLLRALDALPERDRLVLSCRFLLGLSEAETAAALDCAAGTVKSRTSRALDRLRAQLEPMGANVDG
jgi:RNA polymerase sigma-70 factor (ECF subfamily)